MSNVNDKICIVGAGPAGLSAAFYLEKKGYKDITVLERLDRVGGKCNSPYYKGKRYEMGAIMGVPTYHATKEICEYVGVKADGPKLDRDFIDAKTGKGIQAFPPELADKVMEQMKKMGTLLATKYAGYDSNGHRDVHPDLMETFEDFCDMNDVALVKYLWLNPFTSFGYGYFNLIPAAYVLKYLDWPTLQAFINKDLLTWENGTQSIWEALSDKLNRKPRLCTKIEKVTREDGKVNVYTEFGKELYDKIIFASPLQDLKYYVDINEEEEKYFSKIICEDYKVFACTVKNYPTISGYIPENMVQNRAGHVMVYYHRWKDDPNQIITAYVLGNPQEKVGVAECKALVEEDMKIFNVEVDDIVMHKSWRYFPHINTDEYKRGWYDKVEGWQGNNNTFFAGEIMSYGDIDEVVQYSKELVERFF